MNLIIPGVGTESGPTYAFDVNSSLSLIDQHDHSPGRGVKITPAGLNINATLNINQNILENVSALDFYFTSSSSVSSVAGSLSVAVGSGTGSGDLYFTDGNGTQIQVTKSGSLNVVASSIPGETYSSGTFIWTQDQSSLPTTPANFDIGSITLRPNVAATTNGVTLSPPSAISSAYTINLPALPATNSIQFIDSSGNMTTQQYLTNTNIADNTITGAKVTANTLDASKIINNTVGLTQLATSVLQWNSSVFNASGTFTVPSNVNSLLVLGCGGGAGGGSGAAATTTGNGTTGGAGGSGSVPSLLYVPVTPAEVLTVTIGAGGAGGAAVASTTSQNGNAGSSGGNTTITGTGVNIVFGGATSPGAGGIVNSMVTNSGTEVYHAIGSTSLGGSGGAGGNGSGGSNGSAGTSGGPTNYYNSVSTAGTGGVGPDSSRGGAGGGGGGGSGFAAGGNGSNGTNGTPSSAGSDAAANSGAGGGGSGGARDSVLTIATGKGGDGGSGKVTIYWLGHS